MSQTQLSQSGIESSEQAVCLTNSHGRMLSANRRFCRMFGIEDDSVEWRYLVDFHRSMGDWNRFRETMESTGRIDHSVFRLRHRKGRSFQCVVSSVRLIDDRGRICYRTCISKISTQESVQTITPSTGHMGDSVVYLNVCHACGQVKGSDGNWIRPMKPVASIAHRQACYCPQCSSQLFPGILDQQPLTVAIGQ